jgi:hypothetical protein
VSTQKIGSVIGKKMLLIDAMSVKGDSPGQLVSTGRWRWRLTRWGGRRRVGAGDSRELGRADG